MKRLFEFKSTKQLSALGLLLGLVFAVSWPYSTQADEFGARIYTNAAGYTKWAAALKPIFAKMELGK